MGNQTTFVDKQTVITAGWANDVDHLVFALLGDGVNAPNTAADVRTALGLSAAAVNGGNTAVNITYTPGGSSHIPGIDATVQAALDFVGGEAYSAQQVANAAMPAAGGLWSGPTTYQSAATDGSDVDLKFHTTAASLTALSLTMRLNPTSGAFEYMNTAGQVVSSLSDAGTLSAWALSAGGSLFNVANAGSYGHMLWQRGASTYFDLYLDTGNNFGINANNGGSPVNALSINQSGLVTIGQRPYFGANLAWDAGNFNPAQYATLNSPSTFTTTVTVPYLSSTGKVFGVNSPNLIPNASAELGLSGWSGSGWLAYSDVNGTYIGFQGTGTNQSGSLTTPRGVCSAGAPVTVQFEASLTTVTAAQSAQVNVAYYSASGQLIRTDTIALTLGSSWKWYWGTFTTPSSAVGVDVTIQMTGATVGTGSTPAIRRIKVEPGSVPSLYSQEATINSGLLPAVVQVGYAASSSRIKADFSNAVYAQRALFQTLTGAGSTVVGAIPGATGTGSKWMAHGSPDPANSSRLSIGFADGTPDTAIINSDATGSGTARALQFQIGGTSRTILDTNGNWLFGVDKSSVTDDGTSLLQVNGIIRSLQGGLMFPDGTTQTTANGITAPASTVFSVKNANVALGATTLVTTGYTAPFVGLYRNGNKCISGVNYTLSSDSHTINLTDPVTNTDSYEVLTGVIYSPTSVVAPTSTVFTPAAGAVSIPISFTPGFARVYQGGQRLISGYDFDQSSGTAIALTQAANGVDQYEVEVWSPLTVSGMMPTSGGVFTGPITLSGLTRVAAAGLQFSDGTQLATAPFGRNVVINGDARVAQYSGNAVAATNNAAVYGGVDRFLCFNGGGAGGQFTQSQSTLTYNGVTHKCVTQTVNSPVASFAAGAYWAGVLQPIEGQNCYHLIGGPVTMSFLFLSNVTGTFAVSMRDYTGNNSVVTTFSATAGVVTKVTFTTTLPTAMTTPNSSAGGMYVSIGAIGGTTWQSPSVGTWQSSNYFTAAGAVNWAAAANNYIALTQLQLEYGTQATPFEHRSFQSELDLCRRYFQSNSGLATDLVGDCMFSGNVTSGNTYHSSVKFATKMRAAPSVTLSQNSATSFALANASYTAGPSADGFILQNNATATGAGNFFYGWTANAEL